MQDQSTSKHSVPIYQRGNKPLTFRMAEPGALIIRVRHQQHIREWEHERTWIHLAKPVDAESRALALQVMGGLPDDTPYLVRPARPQSLRLVWRAAREYCAGNYLRASQLVEKAIRAITFELDRRCWQDLHALNAVNGLRHAIMQPGPHRPDTVMAIWEAEANWWTCGQWPGSGLLGKMMDRIGEAAAKIAQEERAAAKQRLTHKDQPKR